MGFLQNPLQACLGPHIYIYIYIYGRNISRVLMYNAHVLDGSSSQTQGILMNCKGREIFKRVHQGCQGIRFIGFVSGFIP